MVSNVGYGKPYKVSEMLASVSVGGGNTTKMQKVYDEMARVQDQIDATNTWGLDREIEIAFDVMNLPDKDADVTDEANVHHNGIGIVPY